MTRILLVDDDRALRTAFRKALGRRGVEVVEAEDGVNALAMLQTGVSPKGPLDGCILDLRMPHLDGLEVLRRTPCRPMPVVVLTGHGSVEDAVTAMRLGAADFVQKPVDVEELWPVLAGALEDAKRPASEVFIGNSPVMQRFNMRLERAASSDESVLILGETGSGKRLAARRVHEFSGRAAQPFVVFHAVRADHEGARVALFGRAENEDGAAVPGLFARAAGGTLFIDELAELPFDAQGLLFAALEDGVYTPVGGERSVPIACRLVGASTQDLAALVSAGEFRAELFYRLNVLPIDVPPLRDRGADVLDITRAWLTRLAPSAAIKWCLSEAAKEALLAHPFAGNVRELINAVKRVVTFSEGPIIDVEDMQEALRASAPIPRVARAVAPAQPVAAAPVVLAPQPSAADTEPVRSQDGPAVGERVTLESLERAHIETLLAETGNVSAVARIVGVDRRTLQRKLNAWGTKRPGAT